MIGTEYSEYKLLHHKQALLDDRPPFTMWDLSGVCNHRCKHCVSYTKELYDPKSMFDESYVKPVAEQLKALGVQAIHFTGGGEPLVFSKFAQTAEMLLGMGFQLSLVTNGALLGKVPVETLKQFTWIRISIDAIRNETYQIVRGAKSINPILAVVDDVVPVLSKAGVTVGASFVTFDENVSEIYPFTAWAKSRKFNNIRISYGWTPAGMDILDATRAEANKQLDMLEEDKIADDNFSVFTMRHRLMVGETREFTHCWYSDAVVIIAADGCVYRCCVLKYTEEGKLGSVYEQPLQEIWKNRGTQDVDKCPMCYANTKAKFAEYMMCDNPKHVNFI